MANIEVIDYDDSTGRLKEIYDDLIKSRGKLAEVHKIQSLNPETIVNHMDLYMSLMFGNSPISRYQREMIAVVVSKENQCKYCVMHHTEAVNHFWRDKEKCQLLIDDFESIELGDKDIALCRYAQKLTSAPGAANDEDLTQLLKEVGFDDRAILDATMIVAYFNFVNRIVLALDVSLESDHSGYNYE
jgi:uncharacterized peroxidase-related enzyme